VEAVWSLYASQLLLERLPSFALQEAQGAVQGRHSCHVQYWLWSKLRKLGQEGRAFVVSMHTRYDHERAVFCRLVVC
jgi:hypothetical protein